MKIPDEIKPELVSAAQSAEAAPEFDSFWNEVAEQYDALTDAPEVSKIVQPNQSILRTN